MTKFDVPIFIKPSHPEGDVIVFGKGPDLELEDGRNGIARFGGAWRTPSYFRAYLRSAAILVKHSIDNHELDDVALPAFYMQRHALELLIKRLLSWLYELAEFRRELENKDQGVPSGKQKERLGNCHSLGSLLNDLQTTVEHFGFNAPPVELKALVNLMAEFEKTDTWSRYETSKAKHGVLIHHVRDEIVLPLTQIQQQLELVALKTAFQYAGEDAYENEIYNEWLFAARATGRAG